MSSLQLPGGDGHPDAAGDLLVQRCGASRVYFIEHADCQVYRCTNTVGRKGRCVKGGPIRWAGQLPSLDSRAVGPKATQKKKRLLTSAMPCANTWMLYRTSCKGLRSAKSTSLCSAQTCGRSGSFGSSCLSTPPHDSNAEWAESYLEMCGSPGSAWQSRANKPGLGPGASLRTMPARRARPRQGGTQLAPPPAFGNRNSATLH